MRKTFKYRLYPNKQQTRLLQQQLEECRWLYNHLLAERKTAWDERHESLSYYEQAKALPMLKAERPTLAAVHSQVLQNVAVRLDLAFQAFFRRERAGEIPGYPRFRGYGRYASLTYPQVPVGCRLDAEERRVRVANVGRVKIILHRPLEGTPKTATISRSSTGKWYVCFSCECEDPSPLPETERQVGIDVGLKTFAMCSTGEAIENPRFFRTAERALAQAQRRHQVALDAHYALRARLTRQLMAERPDLDAGQVWAQVSLDPAERAAWQERQRRRRVVARVQERIRWRRGDFAHQHSRRLVNTCELIAVEDLSIQGMLRNHRLAKSIADAAWNQFTSLLSYKAAWAGRKFVAVDPKHTSQDCSGCGWRDAALTLADRVFRCANPAQPDCGLVLDRDLNAARNILSVGQHALASA